MQSSDQNQENMKKSKSVKSANLIGKSGKISADQDEVINFDEIELDEEIDFDVDDSEVGVEEEAAAINGFSQFKLAPEVFDAILALGYQNPTPVQQACLPVLLSKQTDLLALAKTGTGKTAAFGIPLVQKLSTEKKLQALVLCPTRELAAQVASNLQGIGSKKGIRVVSILGGESYRRQIDALKLKPQVMVSTPGRLIDLMDQKIVSLEGVSTLILDEADEMLSFGFQDALETIWKDLEQDGNEVNTWLFSATMSSSIRRLTSKYLKTPFEVSLNQTQEPVRVESFAAVVYEEDKEDALCLSLLNTQDFYGIIFAQTKQQVANLELRLRQIGLSVDSLHGDKAQADRTRTIGRMKRKEVKILVATDVAARGLDIEDLTHVVNFELPWDVETYTHRIGRTARAGKTGVVWNFVKPKDVHQLRKFENALKFKFKTLKVPSVQEVNFQQKLRWVKSVDAISGFQHTLNEMDQLLTSLNEEAAASGSEAKYNMSEETKVWLAKAISFQRLGVPGNLRQPRSYELKPAGAGSSDRSRSFGRGDDRGERGGRDRDRGGNRRRSFSGGGGGYRSASSSERSDRFTSSSDRSERPERADRPGRSDRRSEGGRSFEKSSERSFSGPRSEVRASKFYGSRDERNSSTRTSSGRRSRPERQ